MVEGRLEVTLTIDGHHRGNKDRRRQPKPKKPHFHVGHHHGQRRQPLREHIDQNDGASMAKASTKKAVMEMATIWIKGGVTIAETPHYDGGHIGQGQRKNQ
jgi:hypothetical protein